MAADFLAFAAGAVAAIAGSVVPAVAALYGRWLDRKHELEKIRVQHELETTTVDAQRRRKNYVVILKAARTIESIARELPVQLKGDDEQARQHRYQAMLSDAAVDLDAAIADTDLDGDEEIVTLYDSMRGSLVAYAVALRHIEQGIPTDFERWSRRIEQQMRELRSSLRQRLAGVRGTPSHETVSGALPSVGEVDRSDSSE